MAEIKNNTKKRANGNAVAAGTSSGKTSAANKEEGGRGKGRCGGSRE